MYDLRSKEDEPSTERPEFPELPKRRALRDESENEHHAGYWVAIFLLAIAIFSVIMLNLKNVI